MERITEVIMGVCITVITYINGCTELLIPYMVVLILELITGLSKGYVQHNLSSKILRQGILRKGLSFIVIILAGVIDKLLPLGDVQMLGAIDLSLVNITILYYLGMEALSILENLGEMGIKTPKILKGRLEQLNKITTDEEEKEEKEKKEQEGEDKYGYKYK